MDMYDAAWLALRIGVAAVLGFAWVAAIVCWIGIALGYHHEH